MIPVNPSTTALLVVHLQHDIVSPDTAFGRVFAAEADRTQVVTTADHLAQTLRGAGGQVVPVRIAFAPDRSDLKPSLPLLRMVADADCLIEDQPGSQIVPGFTVGSSDLVVTHQRPGPFTDSGLHQHLIDRGIETVVVCGVATNASVESAVRQAADLAYQTLVVADACSAADQAAHEASLSSMQLFAAVVDADHLQAAFHSN